MVAQSPRAGIVGPSISTPSDLGRSFPLLTLEHLDAGFLSKCVLRVFTASCVDVVFLSESKAALPLPPTTTAGTNTKLAIA